MIQKLQIYITDSTDPYWNLATEKLLLDSVEPGCCILYLWQNKNTVVIGRNQNPWAECRMSLLKEENVHLTRRLSGGGAVFHDLGNLNFTFLLRDEDFDLAKQQAVIQTACAYAGIRAEVSGRNDILADGRKFSGNAFYHSRGHAYHHGTLLIDTDSEKLSRYLTPPKAKLAAKGVSSVRSRVVNLRQLAPELTCKQMVQYMCDAFSQVYALPAQNIHLSPADTLQIRQTAADFMSPDWLYGTTPPFGFSCEAYFSWGHFSLQLQTQKNIVTTAKVYTDAMDCSVAETVENALTGKTFDLSSLCDALQQSALEETICSDLQALLQAQLQ